MYGSRSRVASTSTPRLASTDPKTYPDDAFGSLEPTLYLTAAMTGLRQGELIGLRWRDVDLDARKVCVVSPYVRGEFNDPKSEGSGRSVPLAKRVVEALSELRDRAAYSDDGELVFCHPESRRPLDRSNAHSPLQGRHQKC